MLSFHLAAAPAKNPPNLEFQIDPRIATGQIPDAPCRAVVPTRVRSTTLLADRFFERRTSVMTRAFESPKTPRTNSSGRKPGNRYSSFLHAMRSSFAPSRKINRSSKRVVQLSARATSHIGRSPTVRRMTRTLLSLQARSKAKCVYSDTSMRLSTSGQWAPTTLGASLQVAARLRFRPPSNP
jgi:hypothetical protein